VLVLEFRVRARARFKVRARFGDSWGTNRLGTKRLGYEMSGSRAFAPIQTPDLSQVLSIACKSHSISSSWV